jgi:hypothetical protein
VESTYVRIGLGGRGGLGRNGGRAAPPSLRTGCRGRPQWKRPARNSKAPGWMWSSMRPRTRAFALGLPRHLHNGEADRSIRSRVHPQTRTSVPRATAIWLHVRLFVGVPSPHPLPTVRRDPFITRTRHSLHRLFPVPALEHPKQPGDKTPLDGVRRGFREASGSLAGILHQRAHE